MSLEMLAHPAPWHGSPLQGIVIICSGTRRSSDSKEQVCTPYGARGDAQNPWEFWNQGEVRPWGGAWSGWSLEGWMGGSSD